MTEYSRIFCQAEALLQGERLPLPNMANFSALLMEALPAVNWVGFYLRMGEELVLGPFQGKPACIRIPLGKGVCGTGAEKNQTQRVEDVQQFPGHIACDSASRSELVVPIRSGGAVVGVLDIDSPVLGRFQEEDQREIEKMVHLLEKACDWS